VENKVNIYFDNNASTPVDKRVVEVMLPYFNQQYGNPSSLHSFGVEAKEAVERSRKTIAGLLNVGPDEIFFTSGGTESNNFAIKSCAFTNRVKGNNIIVSAVEHDCIIESCNWLKRLGFAITVLPVDSEGFVDPDELSRSITNETVLVSVMHANNEIGTIEPIDAIAEICNNRGITFHTDACQSFGKIPLNLKNIDMMTFSAHKIYGPKGIGALYCRKSTQLQPWQHGGNQEYGMRSATENVPAIVGFAGAAEICFEEMERESSRQIHLRDKLINKLLSTGNIYLNGPREDRLPNNVNFGISGNEGNAAKLLMMLHDRGIAVSTGSACSSNRGSASHVLTALGLNQVEALGAVRLSLGRYNTEEEIDYFLDILPSIMEQL